MNTLELKRQIAGKIRSRLLACATEGYWLCDNCAAVNSRVESETGQPHHCGVCHSTRLSYQPAVLQSGLP